MMKRFRLALGIVALTSMVIAGCGKDSFANATDSVKEEKAEIAITSEADVISTQSSANSHIDFEAIQAQNEEIIAWLQVPGTDIDCPILQSTVSDDFYRSHGADMQPNELGAAYIEMPTMANMCDFNTVIHGSGFESESGIFANLINFENPEFFEKNQKFYIYLPDNQLTYDIWAVFERENTSLIRDFSLAEAKGAREFLDYVYNGRIVGKQIREGWEDLDEYNFLTTLTIDDEDSDKQLVVIGALSYDAAGTINREVIEELDLGPDLMAQ